ncbi:hypothetical protein G7068_04565 [Leucobacter viscericola]|uniref:DUF7674 domain-containing protein n=1 Tax=Leucobacter viscericola TaxID=2714935 RepID=A0A6G7XDI3_9MICO|nr:hypothetical protein [Leucobacter viscericola]QIK62562.1 hypothetical protein G7068_04565 [Leucobacter viscericola]
MENNFSPTTPEDNDFSAALADSVHDLTPLWEEHMNDPIDEALPYIFLSDVARWAEANAVEHEDTVLQILSILNDGYLHGQGDVPNLIRVGFGESILIDTPLVPLLTGELRKWHNLDFGLTN